MLFSSRDLHLTFTAVISRLTFRSRHQAARADWKKNTLQGYAPAMWTGKAWSQPCLHSCALQQILVLPSGGDLWLVAGGRQSAPTPMFIVRLQRIHSPSRHQIFLLPTMWVHGGHCTLACIDCDCGVCISPLTRRCSKSGSLSLTWLTSFAQDFCKMGMIKFQFWFQV